MVAQLLYIFTKWPRHLLCESLLSPRQNEVRCLAITCYANGEMTEEYSIFLESCECHIVTVTPRLLHFYEEFTNYVKE